MAPSGLNFAPCPPISCETKRPKQPSKVRRFLWDKCCNAFRHAQMASQSPPVIRSSMPCVIPDVSFRGSESVSGTHDHRQPRIRASATRSPKFVAGWALQKKPQGGSHDASFGFHGRTIQWPKPLMGMVLCAQAVGRVDVRLDVDGGADTDKKSFELILNLHKFYALHPCTE